mmetsp:Transcript_2396/g.5515  ORF Transcript_2396/g.5515 Transcript_2396/m.5515 type:complete len:207 (+) Transcript_2396:324-944(+)
MVNRKRLELGLLLLPDEGLNTLVESSDDLSLLNAETGRRGDVNGTVGADRGVLTTNSTHGESKGLAHSLGLGIGAISSEVGDLDVDRSTHTSTKVGRARSDVSVLLGVSELASSLLNNTTGNTETIKDLVENSSLLHAHNAKVVLLAYPDDELTISALVAAATIRPLRSDSSTSEVGVVSHILEHHTVVDKFLVLLIADAVLSAGG